MSHVVSGIYVIRNTVSGRVYVGSAGNIRRRWAQHRYQLRLGIHHSKALQRSWVKHGSDSFCWEILEEVPTDRLLVQEQYWIDRLHAACHRRGCNALPVAGSPLGTKASAETRAKISAQRKGRPLGPQTPEHIAKVAAANTGRKHSDKVRAAMSASRKGRKMSPEGAAAIRAVLLARNSTPEARARTAEIGRSTKGRKHSEETRAKMSVAGKGQKKSPEHVAAILAAKARKRATCEAQALDFAQQRQDDDSHHQQPDEPARAVAPAGAPGVERHDPADNREEEEDQQDGAEGHCLVSGFASSRGDLYVKP